MDPSQESESQYLLSSEFVWKDTLEDGVNKFKNLNNSIKEQTAEALK